MKLTKLHIFLIILVALILCPTLGACSIQEGISNQVNISSNQDNISSNRYNMPSMDTILG